MLVFAQGFAQRILGWNRSADLLLVAALHSSARCLAPQVTVPPLGESVSEGTISSVLKQAGDKVQVDEVLAQLETDKVTIDCRSQYAGTVSEVLVKVGDTVKPGTVLCVVGEGAADQAKPAAPAPAAAFNTAGAPQQAAATKPAAPQDTGHRQPMIHFPLRVLPDGRRVSALSAAEADAALSSLQLPSTSAAPKQEAAQQPPHKPAPAAAPAATGTAAVPPATASPGSKAAPTNVTRLQQAPPRQRITQTEIDMINSGGIL